jgi:hypothetical protein
MLRKIIPLIFIASLFYMTQAQAEETGSNLEFHGRIGSISASYTGPQVGSGSFSLPNGIDLEADYFVSNHRSYLLRTIIGLDQKATTTRYSYTGFGARYFLYSQATRADYVIGGTVLTAIPRWRFYLGWDAGLSQALVVQLNPVLGTYASFLDASFCGGTNYQITHDLGIELHLGYGMGVGYTNVSATLTTVRIFLGATLYL